MDLRITKKLTVLIYIIFASVLLYQLHRVCKPDREVLFGYLALDPLQSTSTLPLLSFTSPSDLIVNTCVV